MDIRKNTWLNGGLFTAALIGTLVAQKQELHSLEYICKPALLLILSSWFFFNSRRVGDRFTLLVQAGLFFSLVGDVALMLLHIDQFNFLIGLGAFLLAHICYIMAFADNVAANSAEGNTWPSWLIGSLLVVYGYFFSLLVVPKVDEGIALPVIAYAVTITIMGIVAGFRLGRTYPRSFAMVLAGALLFIASDSLLAYNRFVKPLDEWAWAVMVTYALGQFMIAAGCLLHVLDPEEIRRKAALTT